MDSDGDGLGLSTGGVLVSAGGMLLDGDGLSGGIEALCDGWAEGDGEAWLLPP